jgi:hypothetical protein
MTDTTYGDQSAMDKKILITYATKAVPQLKSPPSLAKASASAVSLWT